MTAILKSVENYVSKCLDFTQTTAGAQKLVKIPKSLISTLIALGRTEPGLAAFSVACNATDETIKCVTALVKLKESIAMTTSTPWATRCITVGLIFEGALVLMKKNAFPIKEHLFTYASRISVLGKFGDHIKSLRFGDIVCKTVFTLTSLEMLKNYAFIASAGFALVTIRTEFKGEKQEDVSAPYRKCIKEACKVIGVVTGTALYLGLVNTNAKKAAAFGLLTATSVTGFVLDASVHKV